jgi:hypothetical protein
MARVLAVTRRPNHVLELRRLGFDVQDLRPDAVPTETDVDESVAVLVDVGDLTRTRATLNVVRSYNAEVPAVVLGAPGDDWLDLENDGRTLLVVPPVSFAQVAVALRTLAALPVDRIPISTDLEQPVPAAPPQHSEDAQVPAEEPDIVQPADSSSATRSTAVTPSLASDEGGRTPRGGAVRRSRPTWRSGRRRQSATMDMTLDEFPDWRAATELVLTHLATVSAAPAVCDGLAAELCAVAQAGAAAILVAEDGCWRVEGGIGLRPIEYRLTLSRTDWVIAQLSVELPVVAIPNTDLVRAQLALTPLARHRSLLAVVFADGGCLALIARDCAPFESEEVAAVLHRLRGESSVLAEALEARRVARRLVHFL